MSRISIELFAIEHESISEISVMGSCRTLKFALFFIYSMNGMSIPFYHTFYYTIQKYKWMNSQRIDCLPLILRSELIASSLLFTIF